MLDSFRTFAAVVVLLPAICVAQSTPIATAVQVPTTHVLAIGRFVRPLTPNEQSSIMPSEVRDTLLLILDGKIEQGWVRKDHRGAVFLMNVTTVKEAHKILERLPLGKAKLMEFDLMPIGPLGPLRMLLDQNSATRR